MKFYVLSITPITASVCSGSTEEFNLTTQWKFNTPFAMQFQVEGAKQVKLQVIPIRLGERKL